jgi:hypothetical protein
MSTPVQKSFWGTGLVVSFGVFVAAVLVMVYIAASQRVDLVSDRYYEQALRYQDRIDARKRASGAADVLIRNLPGGIELAFPPSARPDGSRGTIVLYRPADQRRDVTIGLAADSAGVQRISTATLDPGLWRVNIEWTAGGVVRYHEEPVLIR